MNWRKIISISIIIICIISINLAIYLNITEKDHMSKNGMEEAIIDTVELTENFENIFDNKIDYQENDITAMKKKDNSKELVYTNYTKQVREDGKYDINANIPYINIDNSKIENINREINEIFYNKINDILIKTNNTETIYNVKYKAYINENILSLIISSNLKEGDNSQRLIIKTYNYNISSDEILDINQALNYRNLNSKEVQNKINNTIKEAAKTASTYQELGYNKYLRDLDDEMYKVENTKVFFIGAGKSLYILYPYGNSNYTTELDLLVI